MSPSMQSRHLPSFLDAYVHPSRVPHLRDSFTVAKLGIRATRQPFSLIDIQLGLAHSPQAEADFILIKIRDNLDPANRPLTSHMVDIDLIVNTLRAHGHKVE